MLPRSGDTAFYPYSLHPDLPPPSQASHANSISQALSLLELVLDPEAPRRCTPREALAHPFLSVEGETDDDTFPWPFGEGVCGPWHHVNHGQPCVSVMAKEEDGEAEIKVLTLTAGQGIAIGREPCEYHKSPEYLNYRPVE